VVTPAREARGGEGWGRLMLPTVGKRSEVRVARARGQVDSLRAEIGAWLETRQGQPRYARFSRHFEVLAVVLERLIAAIDSSFDQLEIAADTIGSGRLYQRCRAAERSLQVVRRTFEWYARKYEQREDPRLEPVLRAADEVVRSCWSEPFAALGRTPPSSPLVFLEPRFDAVATPRVSVPPDLRAPGDELIGDLVRELPIATIALPSACPTEPWWLVLVAHEVGHHVLRELVPTGEAAARTQVERAVSTAPGGEPDLVQDWSRWTVEAFADTFSMLMTGSAAAWAVDELQHAPADQLARVPERGDRYPPPAVRLALLGEIAACLDVRGVLPDARAVRQWLDNLTDDTLARTARAAAERHLRVTPNVARALVDLSLGGTSLRQLCNWDAGRFAEDGPIAVWAAQLVRSQPIIPKRDQRWAARVGVAGGVAAYLTLVDSRQSLTTLVDNLASQLARAGGPGVLAAPPLADDIPHIADLFAERILQET
jgi:hypothetical protein